MSEALFIVCIAVICALALVLIVWLIVSLVQMNKNKKFQKEQLQKEGYTEFKEFYRDPLKR